MSQDLSEVTTPPQTTAETKNTSIYLTEARVFIAGVLMPTIQVHITMTFNQPPTAQVVVPAHAELFQIGDRDRVPVHIFVRETVAESPEFILMFEGFVASTSYMTSQMQRAVSFSCISVFDILNDVHIRFMSQINDLYEKCVPGRNDTSSYVMTNGLMFPDCLFYYGLQVPKEDGGDFSFIKCPSDYLDNIYAFMQLAASKSSVAEGETPPQGLPPEEEGKNVLQIKAKHRTGGRELRILGNMQSSALSTYYGNQARYLNFLDRYVRLPYFDIPGPDPESDNALKTAWELCGFPQQDPEMATSFPMLYGLQANGAMNQVHQRATQASPRRSLSELLTFLVNEMEYEYLFISNPAYHGKPAPKEEEDSAEGDDYTALEELGAMDVYTKEMHAYNTKLRVNGAPEEVLQKDNADLLRATNVSRGRSVRFGVQAEEAVRTSAGIRKANTDSMASRAGLDSAKAKEAYERGRAKATADLGTDDGTGRRARLAKERMNTYKDYSASQKLAYAEKYGVTPSDNLRKKAEAEKAAKQQQQAKDAGGEEVRSKVVSSVLKPMFMDAMPPQCNILFRSIVDSMQTQMVYKGVPTRVQIVDSHSALAKLTQGGATSPLAQFGLIDYYPSYEYAKKDPDAAQSSPTRWLSSEMLEDEKFTGPWVSTVGVPPWFPYINNSNLFAQGGSDAGVENPAKVFQERFFRRQLLSSKYLTRQVAATCLFDPYVTPGFPGVVFDGADTNIAFAGHVVSVEHSISPRDVSTTVHFNFARLLPEAAAQPIPNPLNAVHKINHDIRYLSNVYRAILGTPDVTSISGANAITFETLNSEYLSSRNMDSTDPNNNPQEAYKFKRRNIVTFDDYCAFMEFTVTYDNGPEGPRTPIQLSGEYLDDRRKIQVFNIVEPQTDVIPEKENNFPDVGSSPDSAGGGKPTPKVSDSSKVSKYDPQVLKQTTVAEKDARMQEDSKNTTRTMYKANATAAAAAKDTIVKLMDSEIDVRGLLRKIAQEEFDRVIFM